MEMQTLPLGPRVLHFDLPSKPVAAVEPLVCAPLHWCKVTVSCFAVPPHHWASTASSQLLTETWVSGFLLGFFLLDTHL